MWSVDEHVIRNEKDVEGTTVRQALADAKQLCERATADTQEARLLRCSADEIRLFSLVLERLEAARDELQSAFAGAPPADRQRALDALTKELVKFSGQLQFYYETSVASRVLYHKKAVRAMKEVHEGARNVYHYYDGGLDQFFSMIRADKKYPTEWKEPFAQSVTAFEAAVAAVVERAETLDAYKTDALVALEAATLLSNAQRSGDALEWHANKPAQRLRELLKDVADSDDVKLPEWFVSESEINYRSRQFAKGSFGAVHYGTWGSGTKVVVKVLLTDGSSDRLSATLRRKFIDEAELWSKMSHPYVLKLYGACHVTAPPFFVCEDATKGDLKAVLATDKSRLWRLLFQSALAIEYLHSKKVVHGDLKLNNILVGADGYARVADFGLSRFKKPSRDNTLSRQDSVIDGVGALRWRAPEALDSKAQYASDVYSFGLCIIEALSGETPYEHLDDETVAQQIQNHVLPDRPADMSDEIWALVQKMTEPEPSERATIKQVTAALKKLANDELTKETEKVSLCQVCSSRLDDGSLYCRRCQRATVAKPVSKEVGPILSKEDLPRVIELVTLSDSGHEHKAPNALRDYMFGQPDHQRYVFEAGAIPVLAKVLAEELDNADAQLEALTALGCTMVANKKIQRAAKFENVIEMLKENLNSPLERMQIKSVLVLGYSAHGSPESREEIAGNAEVMDRIRAMAAAGPEDDDLPMAATKALMFLDPQAFSEPATGA